MMQLIMMLLGLLAYHQLKQYLYELDLNEINAPSTASWADGDTTRMRTKFGINMAKKQNWEFGKEELKHIKHGINTICDAHNQDKVTFEMLVHKLVGPERGGIEFTIERVNKVSNQVNKGSIKGAKKDT